MDGLKAIGCDITLLSSTLSSDAQWDVSSVQSLEASCARKVHVYEPTASDRLFVALLSRFYRLLGRHPSVNSALRTPPGMRDWFARTLQEISPDFIWMNYAYWDGLIRDRRLKATPRVIDTLDLVTLNEQMRHALDKYLLLSPPRNAGEVQDEVVVENFFEQLDLAAHPDEFRIYDRYNYTIAISPKEAEIIRQNTRRTEVVLIPMTEEPCYISNVYSGPALFPIGPNPFNIQGYFYFVKKVLPQVRKLAPTFCLQVTGSYYYNRPVFPVEGILLSGFVPDLKVVYESARFVVCPVFGGTGQQIKIVESMAYGVPVIALRGAADGSLIQHGCNGYVANDAEEFAAYVVELWNNKELCGQMGQRARETVAAESSRSRLVEQLSSLVNSGLN